VVLFLVLWLLTPDLARADGGVARLRGEDGPFAITLFSPEPLRVGPTDLGVLVQRGEGGAPVLDALVELELERPDGRTLRAPATRAQAVNQMLHAAMVELDATGRWRVRVSVNSGGDGGELTGELLVDPARPLQDLWLLLALPFLAVGGFALARGLRRRRQALR